jgi:hypothetical protein
VCNLQQNAQMSSMLSKRRQTDLQKKHTVKATGGWIDLHDNNIW